jgi:hypothetical protein
MNEILTLKYVGIEMHEYRLLSQDALQVAQMLDDIVSRSLQVKSELMIKYSTLGSAIFLKMIDYLSSVSDFADRIKKLSH